MADFTRALVIVVACSGFSLLMASETFGDSKPVKKMGASSPTGSCTITVAGMNDTCIAAMTEKSCNDAAAKVHGVANWVEGGKCPDPSPKAP